MVELPLTGRQIPIIADDWAQPEFGTGAVKVTPAHDPNDFAIGQRHNLPNLTILDTTAHVLLPGSKYHGLDRYEARKQVLADLEALGLLVEVKDHAMSVGLSQRSGSVIEPRLSDQWFIRIQPLADKAIAAVKDGHIRFTPEMYAKTYFEWMGNIHDWCISRQLWWGHRIPAWYCAQCGEIAVSRRTPTKCGSCGSADLTQETDVLDTWFSSGLLPFTVFGWPTKDGKPTPEMAAFYPTDVLVTGFDILFFWVARMIMLGTHFMLDVPMPDGSARTLADAVPFREVYIHALVRDADRQKMSKTKGNVIDPIDIVNRFGTDAVRFTLASMASPGTDIAFSEERTDGYRAFANKVWNAARFLLMNLERAREANIAVDFTELRSALAFTNDQLSVQPLETRWILSRLSTAAASVDKALKAYRFDEAASAVYQFFWGELCDWYLEMVKLRLDFAVEDAAGREATRHALTTLVAVFEAALRLLSPFMPFITEEIWHALWANSAEGRAFAASIALTRYPQPGDSVLDELSVETMDLLQQVIVTVRGLRKEIGVPEKEATPIRIFTPSEKAGPAGSAARITFLHRDVLAKMARVSDVTIAPAALAGDGTRSTPHFDVQVEYERVVDVVVERERLNKELARFEKGLAAAERQLGNEVFMAKAPQHIVEGLRRQSEETRAMFSKTVAALAELG